MKVLLVAKPWRGGLASYLFRALQDLFPGEVQWWATRPIHAAERLDFLRNREAWYGRLKERLVSVEAEAMVFINHLKMFDELPPDPRKVLWLTDNPKPRAGELSSYGKIYLSDPGYAEGSPRSSAIGIAERFPSAIARRCTCLPRPPPGATTSASSATGIRSGTAIWISS
jgi:hypothetical protein